MAILLASLPEELLERILALAVFPLSDGVADTTLPASPPIGLPRSSSAPFPSRTPSRSLLPRTTSLQAPPPAKRSVNRSTPLLTNTLFARIGTTLLYTHIHLTSREQCAALVRTLSTRSDLAKRVRSMRIEGAWPEMHELLHIMRVAGSRFEVFDMVVCSPDRRGSLTAPTDSAAFCSALALLPTFGTVKSLAVRKTSDAYLTLPGPASIIECLSDTLGSWNSLVSLILVKARLHSLLACRKRSILVSGCLQGHVVHSARLSYPLTQARLHHA